MALLQAFSQCTGQRLWHRRDDYEDAFSGGVSFEMAVVVVDQRTGELLLQVDELKPVRFELVATRLSLVQGLALYDELTGRSL